MIFLLLVGVGVSYANNTYSQTTKLTFSLKNKTIKEIFSEIEKNSEYIFLYNDANLDVTKKVSVNVNNQTIDKVLDEVFKDTGNTYYVSDRQIFVSRTKKDTAIKKDKEQAEQAPVQQITITGTVTDAEGEPLIGVAIKPKSKPTEGVTTNQDGKFSIGVGSMNETLLFTYVGMKSQELKLKAGTTNYKIVMESLESELGPVVVEAGIIQRNKLGFTGSYKTVSQEELRAVGNMNVLQSLRSLNPSFAIAENNLGGSNPNQLANISLRGGSTMNITSTFDDLSVNPNEPLFVLDGFPTTLQTVNDLDINRIESITILKDASSTAIYGSQGGNGVIVIETVKPKPGELRVSYNGNMQLSVADLSVYNMMNAAEKLDFEVKSGRYKFVYNNEWINVDDNRWEAWLNPNLSKYISRLENVKAGVDTYWLKVPVRTGLRHDHSIYIDGGESSILYQIGVQFRNEEGVMKGSSRETFGGNVKLQYRKGNINVQNNLTVSVTNGHNGSWGSFSAFANANPYYRMINEDGTIPSLLDSYDDALDERDVSAFNPYYNAMLKSIDDTRNLLLMNNTNFEWRILPNMRWVGSLQIQTTRNESETFKDPRHTDFDGLDYTLQGTYESTNGSQWSYDASTTLTYSESIKDAHNLTFTGRAGVRSMQTKGDGYFVTGFPKGVPGIPSYSYDYKEGSHPSYSESVTRMASFLAALNYNYKYRYLLDFTLQNEGTTSFGKNQKFQTFWSVGAGWNINREPFAEGWTWAEYLKIRGSYGKNGNQNVNNVSTNIYSYYPGNDIFGPGAYLSQFANPNLRWQVVTKTSAGLDVTIMDNRLNLTFDAYRTKTDPLVIDPEQKPSTGVSTYPMNLGYVDAKGLELSASYQIIKNIPKGILLSARLMSRIGRQTYGGFADALNNMNNEFKNETETGIRPELNKNSLVQYRDGNSPDDLWAVRSLGIDPTTGREIYLDRFGTPTFDYNPDDRVVIASRAPDVQGIFGLTFRIKDFTANFNFSYSLGGYGFNDALYRKVENISVGSIVFNQDRRALYDRWQSAGDISQFKNIEVIGLMHGSATNTPISSRFIQRNNYLAGNDAKLSWEFTRNNWIKSLGMEYLSLNLSYTDLFYLSTMKRERGTDYPFARSVSFGISAQF
jgi:TonB-linked SusC/RagA family outer membrane protein